MRFLKIYLMTLVFSIMFVFLGGWMLLDFDHRPYTATAACAFLIAVVIVLFVSLEEKIEQLEKRIKELEETMQEKKP